MHQKTTASMQMLLINGVPTAMKTGWFPMRLTKRIMLRLLVAIRSLIAKHT